MEQSDLSFQEDSIHKDYQELLSSYDYLLDLVIDLIDSNDHEFQTALDTLEEHVNNL